MSQCNMAIGYRNLKAYPLDPLYFHMQIDPYDSRPITVIELGAGANPVLVPEYVKARNITYLASDLSSDELDKADPIYERLIFDASAGVVPPSLEGRFDCVLSKMVAEHIKDGKDYHRTIFRLLKPGGIAVHTFPTLWALPFAVNRLMPNTLTDRLLDLINPRDHYKRGKFPAYYSWARGPSKKMVGRFEGLGYEILDYIGYFGHGYYEIRSPFLHRLEFKKAAMLTARPISALCSYATLTLRRPYEDA